MSLVLMNGVCVCDPLMCVQRAVLIKNWEADVCIWIRYFVLFCNAKAITTALFHMFCLCVSNLVLLSFPVCSCFGVDVNIVKTVGEVPLVVPPT